MLICVDQICYCFNIFFKCYLNVFSQIIFLLVVQLVF